MPETSPSPGPHRPTSAQLPEMIEALLDPGAYADRPERVELVQTHISFVLLAGDCVYKLKKPVRFGFLDFSTPELRHASCLEEVRLNRRLSPDVYLDVVPVRRDGGRYRFGGTGAPLDWAVQMRRLPGDRMLEALIAAGDVPAGTGDRLGEIAGRFHLEAERGDRITALGGGPAVAANWQMNFDETQPFRGRTIAVSADDRIRAYAGGFLEREAPLLAQRDADGFIRDLHGDLRSAQIWVMDEPPPRAAGLTPAEEHLLNSLGGVRILDCIEFNERLRCCDTASDAAFLAMDFAFRRRQDLAEAFLSRYLEVTGDGDLPLLLNFYSCYRAYVRGEVDSLASDQAEIEAAERRRLAGRARRFFRLAARYADRSFPPHLIVMLGISGSGKSFLARLLALRNGAALISSDVTRKRLAGVPATAPAPSAAYSHAMTEHVYAALFDQARTELRRGHPVILDATFLLASQRAPAVALARECGVPLTLVWAQASQVEIRRRLEQRRDDSWNVSDAGRAVMESQRQYFEPPEEIDADSVIRVRTSRRPSLRRTERRLRTIASVPLPLPGGRGSG